MSEQELVPLAQVETLLREKWMVVGTPGSSRACTLNLVAVTSRPEDLSPLLDLLDHTVQHHPSRAIVLVPDETTPDPGMAAAIHMGCPGGQAQQYCCEHILLHVRPAIWQHAISGVLPLLLPELPVALWWLRPFDEDPLFRRLCELTDILIVDSALADSPEGHLRSLPNLRLHCSERLLDLGWTQLTPWRELIAQAFDPMERRPYLWELDHVHISVTDTPEGTVSALYLVGWLAGRLGWRPQTHWKGKGRTRELRFTQDDRDLRVTVHRVDTPHPTPVVRVRLSAQTAQTARFTVEPGDTPTVAHITADVGNVHVRETVRVRWLDRGHAFVEALRLNGHDPFFEEALGIITQILEGR